MPTDDDPLTAEREYLLVRPTTTALVPDHVGTALRALHTTDEGEIPTIEMLLATAGADDGVTYCFGATEISTKQLKRQLRRAFPQEYELTETTTTVADLVTEGSPKLTAESLADAPVAGIEFQATGKWSSDWQTKLHPFDSFTSDERTNWPLSSVIGALASAETPTVFQTLLEPKPDWTALADETIYDYHQPNPTLIDKLVAELFPESAEWERLSTRELPSDRRDRVESIEAVDASTSFRVNARAVAFEPSSSGEPVADGGPRASHGDADGNDHPEVADGRDLESDSESTVKSHPETDAPSPEREQEREREHQRDSDATGDSEDTLKALRSAFSGISSKFYTVTPTRYALGSDDATSLREAIATRTLRGFRLSRRIELALGISIPFSTNTHPQFVADSTTAGGFCFVGGADLPEEASRAVETRAGERTGLDLPPVGILDIYRTEGLEIGIPLTGDRTRSDEPLAIPPALQRLHVLIDGGTGSGKSVSGVSGLLANHAATRGATIAFDPKDSEMADDYERAHYAQYGTLENVYRFDVAEMVPADPFFDVTRQQESGVARSQAVEDVADHTEELLEAIMGDEQFNRAVASPLVIEAIVKAMFDAVHGSDQFTLTDLQRRSGRFAETGHTPPVIDEGLRRELQRIADTNDDTLANIIDGAARRVANAAIDSRVAPLFNYAPDADAESHPGIEPFDWRAKLDEDCVVIIDMGKLRDEPQRVLTLVVLSQIWTALNRRDRERRNSYEGTGDPPLVNIHLEEAGSVAASGIVADLLREGRSFGVGLTLSMQFPEQLRRADEAAYEEAINNIGTVISGKVVDDDALGPVAISDIVNEIVTSVTDPSDHTYYVSRNWL